MRIHNPQIGDIWNIRRDGRLRHLLLVDFDSHRWSALELGYEGIIAFHDTWFNDDHPDHDRWEHIA